MRVKQTETVVPSPEDRLSKAPEEHFPDELEESLPAIVRRQAVSVFLQDLISGPITVHHIIVVQTLTFDGGRSNLMF